MMSCVYSVSLHTMHPGNDGTGSFKMLCYVPEIFLTERIILQRKCNLVSSFRVVVDLQLSVRWVKGVPVFCPRAHQFSSCVCTIKWSEGAGRNGMDAGGGKHPSKYASCAIRQCEKGLLHSHAVEWALMEPTMMTRRERNICDR